MLYNKTVPNSRTLKTEYTLFQIHSLRRRATSAANARISHWGKEQ